MRVRRLGRVALGLVLLLVGCRARMVVREGQRITVDDAMALDLEAAQKAADRGDLLGAMARLSSAERTYPESRLMDRLWWVRARILEKHGDEAGAFRALEELARRWPQGDLAEPAGAEMGALLLGQGKVSEALQKLEPLGREAHDPAVRARSAFLAGEAKMRLGDRIAAVLWVAEAAALFPDEASRSAAREFMHELILHRMTAVELKALLGDLRGRPPADAVLLRLASLAREARSWNEAADWLERFFHSHPGSDLRPQAESLRRELEERKQVRPFTIGLLMTLSGPAAEFGRRALQGAMLAAGAFAPQGGTTEPPLKVIVRDDHGLASGAERGLEELVLDEHVLAVVGPLLAEPARAAALRAQGLEVPLLSLYSSSDLPRLGPYVFLVGLPASEQARLMARYAVETLGLRTFGLLYPKEPYGEELMGAFWDQVRSQGGEITAVESYDPEATDFGPQIRKLVGTYYLDLRQDDRRQWERQRALDEAQGKHHPPREVWRPDPIVDFEGLFIPDYYTNVALILPQLAYYDVTGIQLLGTSGWDNPQLLKLARANADRAILPTLFVPSSRRPEVVRFTQAYTKAYDEPPDLVAALAYDGVRLLASLLGGPAGESRSALQEALRHAKDVPEVSGETSYEGSGEPRKEVFLLQVRDGTMTPVGAVESP